MQILWCWRCKMDVPMLDEREYKVVVTDQMQNAVRELAHCGSDKEVQQRTLELMAAEYERLTGFQIADPWHIFRHTPVGLGAPCSFCGKPLRTARARLCGNCMKPVR
jgi:hypothetical protein